MEMADKSSAPSIEASMAASGDAIIHGSFNTVNIDVSRKTEDILDAVKNNRRRLQDLKVQYTVLVRKGGGLESKPSRKRQMIFHEIIRTIEAMELLKNELIRRGAHFDIDEHDHEHPNAAYKRLMKVKSVSFGVVFWYVVFSLVVVFLWFLTSNEQERELLNIFSGHIAGDKSGR
jgi:hypothetical protein